MSKENDEIRVLTELGFNTSQSKVFLTLSKIGEATAKKVAKAAKIDRAETYRIIAQLREMGFVKKALAYPSRFVAIPINDLLEILIKDKKKQINQIERETTKLFQHFSNENNRAKPKEKYTLVVPKVRMITQEIHEDNRNAKNRIDILTSIQDQTEIGYSEGKNGVETSLKNGVKIRLIIEKPLEAESMPEHILELAQHPNFILRYISEPLEHLIVIQDDEKAWIKMETGGFYNSPWLVSNNPHIIVLARAFFDKIFRDSTLAYERKSECAI